VISPFTFESEIAAPPNHSYQEPLNQRTYHADDFVLALVVVVITR
jgi:hypothetical protein